MKKEIILEALKNAGVELPADKQKQFLRAIQTANGLDIENAKKDYADKTKELADLKAKYDSDLKQRDDQLKKYNNSEIDELRKFKTDTLNAQKSARQETALKNLIGKEDYHFDKKAIDLLAIASKGKVKFNDNDEIENADELMAGLVNDYKDFVVSTKVDGAKPSEVQSKEKVDINSMDYETYKKYRLGTN